MAKFDFIDPATLRAIQEMVESPAMGEIRRMVEANSALYDTLKETALSTRLSAIASMVESPGLREMQRMLEETQKANSALYDSVRQAGLSIGQLFAEGGIQAKTMAEQISKLYSAPWLNEAMAASQEAVQALFSLRTEDAFK